MPCYNQYCNQNHRLNEFQLLRNFSLLALESVKNEVVSEHRLQDLKEFFYTCHQKFLSTSLSCEIDEEVEVVDRFENMFKQTLERSSKNEDSPANGPITCRRSTRQILKNIKISKDNDKEKKKPPVKKAPPRRKSVAFGEDFEVLLCAPGPSIPLHEGSKNEDSPANGPITCRRSTRQILKNIKISKDNDKEKKKPPVKKAPPRRKSVAFGEDFEVLLCAPGPSIPLHEGSNNEDRPANAPITYRRSPRFVRINKDKPKDKEKKKPPVKKAPPRRKSVTIGESLKIRVSAEDLLRTWKVPVIKLKREPLCTYLKGKSRACGKMIRIPDDNLVVNICAGMKTYVKRNSIQQLPENSSSQVKSNSQIEISYENFDVHFHAGMKTYFQRKSFLNKIAKKNPEVVESTINMQITKTSNNILNETPSVETVQVPESAAFETQSKSQDDVHRSTAEKCALTISSESENIEMEEIPESFLDNEAVDAESYVSGASLYENERQYIAENEIPVRGETISSGSEFVDSNSDYERDSFVVSSDPEDYQLLDTSSDLDSSDHELKINKHSKQKYDERKLKEQKAASREMFLSRHGLLHNGDTSSSLEYINQNVHITSTKKFKRQKILKRKSTLRIESSDSEDTESNVIRTYKRKRMRIESDCLVENDVDVMDHVKPGLTQNIDSTKTNVLNFASTLIGKSTLQIVSSDAEDTISRNSKYINRKRKRMRLESDRLVENEETSVDVVDSDKPGPTQNIAITIPNVPIIQASNSESTIKTYSRKRALLLNSECPIENNETSFNNKDIQDETKSVPMKNTGGTKSKTIEIPTPITEASESLDYQSDSSSSSIDLIMMFPQLLNKGSKKTNKALSEIKEKMRIEEESLFSIESTNISEPLEEPAREGTEVISTVHMSVESVPGHVGVIQPTSTTTFRISVEENSHLLLLNE